MLGEFFAASAADVDEGLVEIGPHGRFATVAANGLSHVPIARLGELLGAGAYDVLVREVDAQPSTSGEAVLFRIPRSIRDALAVADDIELTSRSWAATDELTLSGWNPALAADLVAQLVALARTARSTDADLWYWWSM
jgi:hypothetical protein